MKIAKVSSVCECQSRLGAELDAERKVLRGWTRDQRGRELNSPCTRAGSEDGRFHLVWLCAFCGRNTLRSFDAGALVYQDRPDPAAHA
jgi:hypothetical protein